MKKIVDVCNKEQTVAEKKKWPGGAGGFTINSSPQCRAFSKAFQTYKLKTLLISGPVGAGTINDWCIRTSE